MSSATEPCPIWDGTDDNLLAKVMLGPQVCGTLRSGGMFALDISGALRLKSRPPTDKQKANLSYWIYRHNFHFWQFEWPTRQEDLLVLNDVWVDGHRDCEPSTSERVVTYLRELIRSADADRSPSKDLLMAAGGCPKPRALSELQRHTVEEGWTGSNKPGSEGTSPFQINTSARIYVEEQLGERGENQQTVVPDPAQDESEFLNSKFTISNISNILNLPIDAQVVPIVEARLDEVRRALEAGAHLSVIFLCGSVLECVLLGAARQDPENFNKAKATPKTKTENGSLKPKPFHDWNLAELIDVACEIDVLKLDVKRFSHELRVFRNYIHPHEQMKSGFTPDEHTAGLCLQALKAALASLAGER